MKISKLNLLMLLCDAYQYHSIKYHDRQKTDCNKDLINFHNYKMYEIDRLMEDLKSSSNIKLINDYK